MYWLGEVMSINISYTIGFGVIVPESNLSDNIECYHIAENVIDDWLEENSISGVKYSLVGDFVNGDDYNFFYSSNAIYLNLDTYGNTPAKTSLEIPSTILFDAIENLSKLTMKLGCFDEPSWKVFTNVS